MSKERTILLLAGAVALPLAWPALGSESMSNVVRTATPGKDFASYLVLRTEVPWLKLDIRTEMPKGDFPLGRDADSIGRLAARRAGLERQREFIENGLRRPALDGQADHTEGAIGRPRKRR